MEDSKNLARQIVEALRNIRTPEALFLTRRGTSFKLKNAAKTTAEHLFRKDFVGVYDSHISIEKVTEDLNYKMRELLSEHDK